MTALTLYGDPASPYVTRVIIQARLKGIPLQCPPVPGGNPRSAEFHALNPIGKVPALVHADGTLLPESGVIAEYLEERYPRPALLPAAPWPRAVSRLVARMPDLYVSPCFRPLLPHLDPRQRDPAAVAPQAETLTRAFRALAHFMLPGTFCAGDSPSLGDCALGPYVQLLKNVVFPVFPEIPDPTLVPGRLADWWQAVSGHFEVGACLREYDQAVSRFMAANRERLLAHR